MLARSIPGSARSPGGGHAVHFSILAWRIPRTEEGGLVRRVTKPGARFHMTDFEGGILSRADFCSQGLLGAPKICMEPSTTWSVGEGPSLRVAFGPQHPPPPHTHTILATVWILTVWDIWFSLNHIYPFKILFYCQTGKIFILVWKVSRLTDFNRTLGVKRCQG